MKKNNKLKIGAVDEKELPFFHSNFQYTILFCYIQLDKHVSRISTYILIYVNHPRFLFDSDHFDILIEMINLRYYEKKHFMS